MFNVSFKVSGAKLADTLTRLQPIASAVEVSQIPGDTDAPSKSPASSIPTNGPRRRAYHRKSGRQSDYQRATAILQRVGNEPFKVSHLISKCETEGISAPSVYRCLRLAQNAGFVARLSPGVYQLKSAAA